MYFLLLLLGVSYFFIFFLFSQFLSREGYIIESLFTQANLYIGIAGTICLLVYHQSRKYMKLDHDREQEEKKIYIPNIGEIKDFFGDFFSSYIYYVASILLYVALYFILSSLYPSIEIAHFFLFLNIGVIALYIFAKNVSLGKDLMFVNLGIISFYYVVKHILYFFGFSEVFLGIDIINLLAIFILFTILLFDNGYKKQRNFIEQYFIIFLFLEISVLSRYIFGGSVVPLGIVAGCMGTFGLIFTDEITQKLKISPNISRIWGIIFIALSIVLYSTSTIVLHNTYFLYSFGVGIFSLLLYLFHIRFYSYFALSFSFIACASLIHMLYFSFFYELFLYAYLFVAYLSASVAFLVFSFFSEKKYDFDPYFHRICSIIVNLIGIISFLFFYNISILSLGVLLLCESLYLFYIYYSLRK